MPSWRLRAAVAARRGKVPAAILGAWITIGSFIYRAYGYSWSEAIMLALYLTSPKSALLFTKLYEGIGIGVILGTVAHILIENSLLKYNPAELAREAARKAKNPIVVIGYTHLGARLVSHLKEKKIPYVLVEEDPKPIEKLLRAAEPVIVGDPTDPETLKEAKVNEAKAVIITLDDTEKTLLITKRTRDINKKCILIARCFHDELTEVLEKLGANLVVSSSKTAMKYIAQELKL